MSGQMTSHADESSRTLAVSLAETLSSLCGSQLVPEEGAPIGDVDWLLEATSSATPPSKVLVGLSAADAAAIAERVRGAVVPSDQVGAVLAQVWSGCLERWGDGRATWVGAVAPVERPLETWTATYRLEGPDGFGVTAMVKGECGQPEPAGLERSASPQLARQALPANLDVILDIDLPLAVRFGGTDMTIDALARLGPGALIDLGRSPDDPVDVLVNGRMVARGEVVVIGGNYGVRVTEVVSAADRLRSIGM